MSVQEDPVQREIHQDWANREYIEVITSSIKKIADFLNSFDMSCRSRLATLNEKLTALERRIEYIEARECEANSRQNPLFGRGEGTAMESLDVLIPDLTEEQQDILQRGFAADAKYLENHEKMNQSFWESLVKCLATTDPSILNTEEKNNLLNSCDVLPGGCVACLKAIEEKGVRAMALLYLLLKTSNPSGYRQLPSSKGKDEKLKLLKILEKNFVYPEEDKKSENSSHESMDEDAQGSDEEDLGRQKTEGQLLGGIPAEMVPYRDSEIGRREDSDADAYEKENTHPPQWTVRWMGIRKDDEFFHFVILCFAIGALLVCYYYHKDWTISLGIGLITFASLETTGIYFGLVYRIRSVLDSFVPLIDRFRPRGMRKSA
ncbi:hypothetical protein HGM15179_005148 [Zosterops borbonicus]|uniref:Transmembrane protein 40 n=1 Tax=Zosterops borbonicus TaxID=364589 RepID=A0A8K1GMY1_9PASS|nr:hypothetical protein HGM15179_005148 [Zosterops borbonicus]